MKTPFRRAPLLGLVWAAAAGGCATFGEPGASARADLLTREEILSVQGVSSLYDVVQRLRPRWLIMRAPVRGFGMTTEIVVYENQIYLGNVETLRQLQPGMAFELRWLDGIRAADILPGLGSSQLPAGAIVVTTYDTGGAEGS